MNILLGNIGTIFSNIINWSGQMASSLITNPIFIVLIAVIILKLLYNLIRHIISKREIEKMPYYNLDNDYESKNDSIIDKPTEEWTNEDYDEDVLWSYTHNDY